MARLRVLAAVLGVGVVLGPAAMSAPAGITPPEVLSVMERVADWQLAHPSRHPPADWTQGAGYTGMMALASISASPRFLEAMRRMGEANGWKPGPRIYLADDYCVGQAYAELYLTDRDPRMIEALRRNFDFILSHPKDDNLDFDPIRNPDRLDRWSWCDALFMGPPTWIRLYAATGRKAYLDFAVNKWWKTSDFLYDPGEHLYFRDSTYFSKREANGQKVFWSRGNGWVIAGLARMLEFLPVDDPLRPRFERQFREMAERLRGVQQTDGLWRSSLLDPEDYPAKETSGSGFYCYAFAWGVNNGLLDRAEFAPAALRAWKALVDSVSSEGRLTHVQPVGADPRKFDPDSTEPYGVGAFLLAGSEIHTLVGPTRRLAFAP